MLTLGARLQDRYLVQRRLGHGGMGAVYLARDERLDRDVAVKVLTVTASSHEEALRMEGLFRREARILASLRHPHLARVTDSFEEQGSLYLVMDYVEGRTLAEVGPVPPGTALGWGIQIAEVLAYLHGLRPPILFQDLKPQNVMVDEASHVTLIDFGIARLFESDTAAAATTLGAGTAGYSPPEQYFGRTDPRSDLYSLGATLHALVTGAPPPDAPARLAPGAPPLGPPAEGAFGTAILRLLAVRPEDRFPPPPRPWPLSGPRTRGPSPT